VKVLNFSHFVRSRKMQNFRFFALIWLAKKIEIFAKRELRKFSDEKMRKSRREKCENFTKKKPKRKIIIYNITKFLLLSSQSKEFHKYFCPVAATTIMVFAKFHIFSLYPFLRKKAKFREKVCKIRTKIFVFFPEIFVRWRPYL